MATTTRTFNGTFTSAHNLTPSGESRLGSFEVTSPISYSKESTTQIAFPIPTVYVRIYDDVISNSAVRIAIIVIYLIVILIATFGNILVILVINRRRSLRRNPAVLLILNLAFCDLISCVVYRPLLLVELFLPFTSIQVFNDQLNECRAASYFQGLLAGVGFHTMVLISQERLLLIVYPLKAKLICTYTRTLKMLGVIWLLSALCYLPVPLLYEEIKRFRIDGTLLSFCGYFSGSTSAIIYFSFIFGFYFMIPLAMITASYAKIFKVLYQRMEQLDVTPSTGGSKTLHTRRKLAKMMLGVSVVFALCWGPNFALYLWVACGLGVKENGFFAATIVEFLPIISSAINPFIYTLNSKTFQSGLKHILCARYCRPRLEESSLYRSFNSLHFPSAGFVSPQTAHRNITFSPCNVHRNSTFTRPCRRSVSMPLGQLNAIEKRPRNGLKPKNDLYAHARRNTFINSDWAVDGAAGNHSRESSSRVRTYTKCSLDFQLTEENSFLPKRGIQSIEHLELQTLNSV